VNYGNVIVLKQQLIIVLVNTHTSTSYSIVPRQYSHDQLVQARLFIHF